MQKEDRKALGLFAFKCTEKKAAFEYPLTIYPPAIANPSGTFYQAAAKHLFRNHFANFKPLSHCFENRRNNRT